MKKKTTENSRSRHSAQYTTTSYPTTITFSSLRSYRTTKRKFHKLSSRPDGRLPTSKTSIDPKTFPPGSRGMTTPPPSRDRRQKKPIFSGGSCHDESLFSTGFFCSCSRQERRCEIYFENRRLGCERNAEPRRRR
jgi:hypothetical protein